MLFAASESTDHSMKAFIDLPACISCHLLEDPRTQLPDLYCVPLPDSSKEAKKSLMILTIILQTD